MPIAKTVEKEHSYKEVRGLTRGIELIRALNRMPGGSASTSELARTCGIHRTTAKRLLETLRAEGLVDTGVRDGEYHLTQDVRRLSEGFRNEDWITQGAAPLMHQYVREMLWPCDLATLQGGWMIVRESTHRFSMLSQHNAMVGEKMPILPTALGRAYLAECSEDELEALLRYLDANARPLGIDPSLRLEVHRAIEETRSRGFAVNRGEWTRESRFSAAAVPLFAGGQLLGAVNMVFPKDAISLEELTDRYVPKLKAMALAIGARIPTATTH